eukprot:scaffold39139_cov17-Tisochrysis_lutea.AAC.1
MLQGQGLSSLQWQCLRRPNNALLHFPNNTCHVFPFNNASAATPTPPAGAMNPLYIGPFPKRKKDYVSRKAMCNEDRHHAPTPHRQHSPSPSRQHTEA